MILWDNGKIIESDYRFEDYWDELIEKINKMPKLDNTIINHSQYTNPRYKTWCTIMSGINNLATLLNRRFSDSEISEIYDLAETRWWTPGKAWSRSEWWIAVLKRWNEKNPTNKALLFTIGMFSDEFYLVKDKLWIVWVSLNVDSAYWKDVRGNLKLDSDGPFILSMGHATNIMNTGKYVCVDSIPKDYTDTTDNPMVYQIWTEARLKALRTNKNIRQDCHIIIMENWLNIITDDERARLIGMKSKLEQAIELNSEIWHLTNSETEKEERKRQNNYNRWKLAIVNAMLS